MTPSPLPHNSPAAPASAPLQPEVIEAIGRIFEDAVAEQKTSGMAWGVVRGGAILASGGAGASHLVGGAPAPTSVTPTPASISRIASMTKSFTAATVLALRDEGALRLDDPLADYLPEARSIGRPSADSPALTLRHALTMSAGFVTDNPWGDRQEAMTRKDFARFLEGGLAFVAEPGTGFEYSNTGYALLGRVIDEVTGSDYRDQIRERFLIPLGMHDTFFGLDEATDEQRVRVLEGHRVSDATGLAKFEREPFDAPGVFGAMAGLFSTVQDVGRWVAFLAEVGDGSALTGERADAHRALLSVASRREMQEIHRVQDVPALSDGTGFARVRGYGMGLVIEKFPLLGETVGHSGGYPGFGSYMVWHRHSGLGVIALGNSKYAPATACAMRALEAVREAQPELLAARTPTLDPRTLEALDAALNWLREAPGASDDADSSAEAAALADRWFASNMDQDVSRAERLRLRDAALRLAGLTLDALRSEKATRLLPLSAAQARMIIEGPSGTLQLDLLMEPRASGLIQALNVKGTAREAGEASGTAPIGI
ncbi:MAG: serine hydrolase domain-containing protein [Dermabacter sp.]|nr:serine hydrolase domain-containing protein [Dermabacter sp.]